MLTSHKIYILLVNVLFCLKLLNTVNPKGQQRTVHYKMYVQTDPEETKLVGIFLFIFFYYSLFLQIPVLENDLHCVCDFRICFLILLQYKEEGAKMHFKP